MYEYMTANAVQYTDQATSHKTIVHMQISRTYTLGSTFDPPRLRLANKPHFGTMLYQDKAYHQTPYGHTFLDEASVDIIKTNITVWTLCCGALGPNRRSEKMMYEYMTTNDVAMI